MSDRSTITPGQVWRRPNGLCVLVLRVSPMSADLLPVEIYSTPGSACSACSWDRGGVRSSKMLTAIGGRGWELVAKGVQDPREAR